jgi:hypothetical protein
MSVTIAILKPAAGAAVVDVVVVLSAPPSLPPQPAVSKAATIATRTAAKALRRFTYEP